MNLFTCRFGTSLVRKNLWNFVDQWLVSHIRANLSVINSSSSCWDRASNYAITNSYSQLLERYISSKLLLEQHLIGIIKLSLGVNQIILKTIVHLSPVISIPILSILLLIWLLLIVLVILMFLLLILLHIRLLVVLGLLKSSLRVHRLLAPPAVFIAQVWFGSHFVVLWLKPCSLGELLVVRVSPRVN